MSNPNCRAGCGLICKCGTRRKTTPMDWNISRDEITGMPIKSCPFCGAKASVEEIPIDRSNPDVVKFAVGCDSGEEATCIGYQSLTTFDRRKDAIEAWNKRA